MGRVGGLLRAHPRRAAAVVVAVALLLGGTVVLLGRRGRSPAGAGSAATGRRAESATTGAQDGGAATSGGGDLPGAGGPGSRAGASTASTQAGAPAGGAAGPGSSGAGAPTTAPITPPAGTGVDGGGSPVSLRPPVHCPSTGAPRAPPLPSADERDGRRWVTVQRLAGSCDGSSLPFQLRGIDTRLAWRSDADSFVVFVVDAASGREASAGFADASCSGSCSESQPIVPQAGSYRLEVQAGSAPWEVEIQEYRQP